MILFIMNKMFFKMFWKCFVTLFIENFMYYYEMLEKFWPRVGSGRVGSGFEGPRVGSGLCRDTCSNFQLCTGAPYFPYAGILGG